jgi:simple sugar transport system permease protein
MEYFFLLLSTLDSTLRVATPLILCAMAGIFSERSGIIDIGLEGKMLASAFAAGSMAFVSGSAWIGLLAGISISMLASLIHAFACVTHRGDQVISGLAINILASGLTVVLGIAFFRQGGQTPHLSNSGRFMSIDFPFSESISKFPFLGPIYSDLIGGHNLLVYLAFLSVPVTYYIIYKTRFGLRLRAVGEKPMAVDTAGISVTWLRYRAVLCAGLLCGVAGAYLAIAHGASFGREMSAGKGYIALAAMIFGKWQPRNTLLACLLFGFLEAISDRLQGVPLPFIGEIPVQLMQGLPYILTVVLLAGFIGRAIAPAAIGQPYIKER